MRIIQKHFGLEIRNVNFFAIALRKTNSRVNNFFLSVVSLICDPVYNCETGNLFARTLIDSTTQPILSSIRCHVHHGSRSFCGRNISNRDKKIRLTARYVASCNAKIIPHIVLTHAFRVLIGKQRRRRITYDFTTFAIFRKPHASSRFFTEEKKVVNYRLKFSNI